MDIRDFYVKEGEMPLDNMVTDGGFCGIFRTIGCIGDSLSSGEFEGVPEEGKKLYYDAYDRKNRRGLPEDCYRLLYQNNSQV